MKHISRIALILLLCLALALPAAAAGNTVSVTLRGTPLAGCLLEDSTTWVPLRSFCQQLGSTVGWDGDNDRITVTGEDFTACFTLGSRVVEANDRYFWLSAAPFCRQGITYVPVRGLAKLYGMDVGWDASSWAVTVTGGSPFAGAKEVYNSTDLYWLSRIIFAESGNQPLEGQIAVGNVVMNRLASDEYPNTVKGVIFDTKYGVQFTPAKSGSIYKTPSEQSVMAAKLVLEGAETVPDNTIYFISSKVSESHWMKRTCRLITIIGEHSFFANPT